MLVRESARDCFFWEDAQRSLARTAFQVQANAAALVANDALDLDMDVIGFDPFISVDTAWNLSRNVQRAMSLEELFANSDYITVHVPLTDGTKEMFNKETFAIMKPGVHILNFSRGELVNEEDMAVARDESQSESARVDALDHLEMARIGF